MTVTITERVREIRNTLEELGDRWPDSKLSIKEIIRLTTSLINIEEDVKAMEEFAKPLMQDFAAAIEQPNVTSINAWKKDNKPTNLRNTK